LALRLSNTSAFDSNALIEDVPVQFNAIFEIAETDGAYSFGWHEEGDNLFTQKDVSIGIQQARKDEARAIFLSFPHNYSKVTLFAQEK